MARKMALYRYFKLVEKQESLFLPDPTGPLSSVVPSSTIEAVNRSVFYMTIHKSNFSEICADVHFTKIL